MNEIKRKTAIILALCMIMICVQPAFAERNTDYSEDIVVENDADYAEGNVIVCVEGGAAALNRAFSGGSGQKKMLQRRREFTIDEVLASFESDTEQLTGTENEREAQSEPERPMLFGAVNASFDDTEEILLLKTDDVEGLIEKLEDIPCVRYAQPDYIFKPESYTDGTGEPYYFAQQHLNNLDGGCDMDAGAAWEKYAEGGSDVQVVAVMDTGVDYNHPDLKDVMWNDGTKYEVLTALGGGAHGINTSGEGTSDDPTDRSIGHGTHCASIIAGAWNELGTAGVNATARIMACCWMSATGMTSNYIKAANYVIKAKESGVNVNIVNNSWGSTSRWFYSSPAINDMADRMGRAGIINVFAAGNESTNLDNYSQNLHLVSDMTVSVGAVDSEGDCAVFSNYGQKTVDIMAPGVNILAAASLEPEVMSMPPRYYPWLDAGDGSCSIDSILFCNMENADEICVNAGQAADAQYAEEGSFENTPDEKKPNSILQNEKLTDEGSPDKATSNDAIPEEATSNEVTRDKATSNETTLEEDMQEEADQEEITEEEYFLIENDLEGSSGYTGTIDEENIQEQPDDQMSGTLPELASASVTTRKLYGKDDNHVLTFKAENASGRESGFDLEFRLSEEQIIQIKETSMLHIAFQIARGDGKTTASRFRPMIWNNTTGSFEESQQPNTVFVDPVWNPVSVSFANDNFSDMIDDDNRIRVRFIDSTESDSNETYNIYIDNAGIGATPSQYIYSNGTSMACPNAVGVLSMILGKLRADDSAGSKSDIEIAKEAIAYLKGGVEKTDVLSGKCITGGAVNALNSLTGNVCPVINDFEDIGTGASVIRGYFFGNSKGTVTIDGTPVTVSSWSDREIQIQNISRSKSRAEIKVISAAGKPGRIYADYGAPEGGYEELPPLPVRINEAKLCAAGNTILCFADEGKNPDGKEVTVWKYNESQGSWSRVAMPGKEISLTLGVQYDLSLASGETEIYVLAGRPAETGGGLADVDMPGRLLTYDTVTDTWKHDVDIDISMCAFGILCNYQGELLMLGADTDRTVRKIYPDTGMIYGTLEDMAGTNAMGYAFQVGDDILTVGSINGWIYMLVDIFWPGTNACEFVDILRYDGKAGAWKGSEAPFFRKDSEWLDENTWRQCSAVPLKDGLMITGPVKNNGQSTMTDTWRYKAAEDTYEAYPALFDTMRTAQIASCILDGKMYVLGISENKADEGNVKFSRLDISAMAGSGYPNVKKSPENPEPDPKPFPGPNKSSSLWSGKPVRTGTPEDPVRDGIWSRDADGVWYYHTNAYFRNTWGYIVNPYAVKGQHKADWFWFDASGRMLSGWQFINGKWYFLNPYKDGTYGACFIGPGKTPDGYEIDETGAWTGR